MSGGADLMKTFRIYNDGSTQLVLSGLSVPAGYSVTNFPETVAPLATAEFEAALVAGGGDGQYAGEISFSTNDADVNPFTLMVTGLVDHGATAATAGSISVNAPVAAAIATAGDADWYRFDAVSGVEYRIETSLGTLLDSVLRIRDGAGVELALNDDGEGGLHSTLVWTAPDDGEFYVEVRGKASRTGTYQLSLTAGDTHGNDAASATPTTDPSVNPGAIEAPDDVDWFAFTAAAGVDYRFEALADTLPAGRLQLFGEDGTTLLAPADSGVVEALIDWRAPASGMYYLAVAGGTGSMIGSYRLVITGEDDHGDNAANATLVSAPAAPGEIEERDDVDWFAFNAIEGSTYQLSTAVQGRSNTLLRLIARDGITELDRDEAGPQDSGSFLQWTAPATGRYYLEISGVGERYGEYSLTTSVLDDHGNDATTATLTTDPSDNVGIIESPTDADWFAFEVIAGVSYRLEFTGGALADPLLGAIDVDGQTVLVTSAPGSSAIEWIAPQNGVSYFLVTSASGGRLGDYSLRLTGQDEHGDNAQNATLLNIPSNMPGALQGAADRDWFSFTSVDGLDYRFEATPEAPAVIRLYESDGTTLIAEASGASGAPAVIDWTSTAADVYFLELVAELAAPAVDAPPADVPYALRSSVVGRVPGDYEGDSNVDGHDFLLWQQTVGSTIDLRADGNVDGVVDGADLSFWEVRYGQTFSGPVGAVSGSMAAAEAQAVTEAGEPFGESGESQALPWIAGLDRAGDEARPSLESDLRRVRAESVGGARDRAMATWRLNDRGPEPIRNATALERIMTITERFPWNEDAESEEDEWDEAILEAFGLRGE
jgi:hypothetical protein